jgi:hypothetical protein
MPVVEASTSNNDSEASEAMGNEDSAGELAVPWVEELILIRGVVGY